jgi:hypothetical protein
MADSTNISVFGQEAFFNEDAKFFKDVYIYGTLYYDFEEKPKEIFNDIEVRGTAIFNGNSIFNGDVTIENPINNLTVGILTVTRRLDVGVGGTVLRAISDANTVGSAATLVGNVGIGSNLPQQKLDIAGSVKIDNQIYDSSNDPGVIGAFLTKDGTGIRWTAFEPSFVEGIFVYNDEVLVGVQSFRGLNLKTGRGAGVTTDPVQAFSNPSNPSIADIYVYDYWDFNGNNIYRNSNVGINNSNPLVALDVTGSANITQSLLVGQTLTVNGNTNLKSILDVDGATTLNSTLNVTGITTLNSTLNVVGITTLKSTLTVDGRTYLVGLTTVQTGLVPHQDEGAYLGTHLLPFSEAWIGEIGIATGTTDQEDRTIRSITGKLYLDSKDGTVEVDDNLDVNGSLNVDGATTLNSTLDVDGDTTLNGALNVVGISTFNDSLEVDGAATFNNTVELNSSLIDINNSTAVGKFDYRLSSVGSGVSWRPPGVQTQNAIWVTMDGDDSNSGYLEGDAKRTVGAAASIAQEGDTIFIRSGVYYENNPIGLRTDVSVSGQDLRLVTIVPNNPTKDVFHVRRGCLIENLNFSGTSVSVAHTECGAVAFPPTLEDINAGISYGALSGYLDPGPATEGTSGRWRSPYIRNCTNFMTLSIGMKINGNHATASTIGADLKSMVCDSFTQYNEAGIGVSITNNGYAQLVSLFTINCDIGVYAGTGGQCDLTNSNSSFGNFGLVAVGLGSTEFTAKVNTTTTEEQDVIVFKNSTDGNQVRRPYDGQALYFKINLDNYADTTATGIITAPMRQLREILVINGGSGYSQALPPDITIYDANTNGENPLGPEGIIAELSPNINDLGQITSVDVINSGRNYLDSQDIRVRINGSPTSDLIAVMEPIYFTIFEASSPTPVTGITTVTLNEFVPYLVYENDDIEMRRISRILTSGHSFEYIGTGTDINTSTPLKGAVPIKANEVVSRDGGQVPFTSTDQRGNFDIGEGIQISQTTSTISGRDFSKAIQAEVTPLILALR